MGYLSSYLIGTGTLEVAGETVVTATLVLGLTGLLVATARRASAATRHIIWTIGLVTTTALPLLIVALPSVSIELPAVPGDAPIARSVKPASAPIAPAPLAITSRAVAPVDAVLARHDSARSAATPAATFDRADAASALLLLWAMGATLVIARFASGLAQARAIAAEGREVTDAELDELRRWLGVTRPIRLIENARAAVPMTYGTRRPTLVVPADFATWSASRRRVVLLHELAHIRRLDWLTQSAGQIAKALFWFHPIAWMAERGQRLEAEKAADDVVLRAGTRASTYAEHLLAIVRTLTSAPTLAGTVPMAGSSFEDRVRSILDTGRARGPAGWSRGMLAVLTLTGGAVCLTAVDIAALPPDPSDPVVLLADNDADQDDYRPQGDVGDRDSERDARQERKMERRARDESRTARREQRWADRASQAAGRDAYQEAYQHHRDGEFEAAAELWKKAAELDHDEATSLYNLGCAYARSNHLEQAISALEAADQAGFRFRDYLEADQDLVSLRGEATFRELRERVREENVVAGRRDVRSEALADYQRLVDASSSDADDWYDVGMCLHKLGEYDRAIDAWRQAAGDDGLSGGTTYNIACALSRKGDIGAALDALERAVERGYGSRHYLERDADLDNIRDDARFAEILETVELLELPSVGDGSGFQSWFFMPGWKEARGRYDSYLARHPGSGRAWFNMGYAALHLDDPQSAVEAFGQAYDLGYRRSTSAYNLGCSHARAGDSDSAFQWLNRAVDDGFRSHDHIRGDDDLDSLRDDPRLDELVDRLREQRRSWKAHRESDRAERDHDHHD